MRIIRKYLPIISSLVGAGFIGNAGYTLSAALAMDSSNLLVLLQSVVWAILGLVGVGYSTRSGASVSPDFLDDMKAIERLSINCKGCKESERALATLTEQVIKGLLSNEQETK